MLYLQNGPDGKQDEEGSKPNVTHSYDETQAWTVCGLNPETSGGTWFESFQGSIDDVTCDPCVEGLNDPRRP